MTHDEKRIAAYYDRLVDEYGHDPRAVDASSQDSLDIRYRVLSEVTDLAGKTVLEVGCGFGDLGVFLTEKHPGITYRGIDLSARMIDEGRRANPGLELAQCNVLDLDASASADVVLAQGIFYLLAEDGEAKMQRLLKAMFDLADVAVAFTTTSSWATRKNPTEFYADPEQVTAFASTLTRSLVLRHDYHPGDFAMYLYKSPREP